MSEMPDRPEPAPLDIEQQRVRDRAVTIIRHFREAGREFASHAQLVPTIISTSVRIADAAYQYPERFQINRYEESQDRFANEIEFITFIPYDVQTDTVSAPVSIHRLKDKHPKIPEMYQLYEAEQLTGILFAFSAADRPLYMQGRVIDYQLPGSSAKKLFSSTVAFEYANPYLYTETSTNLTNSLHLPEDSEYEQLYQSIGQELGVIPGEPFRLSDQRDLLMGILGKVHQSLDEIRW